MKTVLFAYHDIGCVAIETLHEMGEEICALFTHEDDPEENNWFNSTKKRAKSLGIPTFTPENPNRPEWIEKIRTIKPEIIFSFYYRTLICKEILNIPPKGGLNLHGSLLPRYRGRAPINWVLVNGEKETGITLHYMVAKPDAGEIVAQKKISILEEDTAFTLYKKIVPLTKELLLETVPILRKGIALRTRQDETKATYYGARKPEDGQIDWTKPSEKIYNLVRAVTHPYPGAFTFLEGKKVFVWWSTQEKSETRKGKTVVPGTVSSLDPLTIHCGKDLLTLNKIQSENEEELNGTDWAKKNSIQIGTLLGKKSK